VGGSLALVLWTIYLGWRLPKVYDSEHWKLAWVGVDTLEVTGLLLTTWAAYRRRVLLIVFATATATMFIFDAWFDVTTARSGDFQQSLITALLVEIPAALVLFSVAIRALRRVITSWQHLDGDRATVRVWSVEIPYWDE
jgi:hypothetical protein